MRIANVTGIPDPNRPAVSALDKAKIDPTDKSIPPVRITKVIQKRSVHLMLLAIVNLTDYLLLKNLN